jgi:hypothetical protein
LNGKSISDVGYKVARDIDGNGVINDLDWQEAIDRYLDQRPAGNPAGAANDAPTTSGFDLVEISDTAIDVAISLSEGFGDIENGTTALSYSIISNSDGALFDSVSIDPVTKQLVVNAADSVTGRAAIVVRATDSGGLNTDAVITIDVNRVNLPPEIHDLSILEVDFGMWLVSGRITDADDDVSDFIVEFSGVFVMRSAVNEEGEFLFSVYLDASQTGTEAVVVSDSHGLYSSIHTRPILPLS